jgi:hypothetical protein
VCSDVVIDSLGFYRLCVSALRTWRPMVAAGEVTLTGEQYRSVAGRAMHARRAPGDGADS